MARKIKLLFCIDTLDMTGASASVVSLLRVLDYSKYDVSLFLFAQQGAYLTQVPREVKILPIVPAYYMATASLAQAVKTGLRKGWFGLAFRRLLGMVSGRKSAQSVKMDIAKRGPMLLGSYDIAIAYCCSYVWQFIIDKVDAKKRVAWLDSAFGRVGALWNRFVVESEIDCIACVSHTNADELSKARPHLANKIQVVHNIIEHTRLDELSHDASPEMLGKLKLVTVGRISEEKGHDKVVGIAMELLKRHIEFNWYLVGPGLEKWDLYLKQHGGPDLQGCVKCLGPRSNPYPCMRNADLVVQPSISEGWGMTVTEALACGAPVMVSDIPVFREQVVDGENGWIVPLDVNSFADKIEAFTNGRLRLSRPGEWLHDYSSPADFDIMCAQLMNGLV